MSYGFNNVFIIMTKLYYAGRMIVVGTSIT